MIDEFVNLRPVRAIVRSVDVRFDAFHCSSADFRRFLLLTMLPLLLLLLFPRSSPQLSCSLFLQPLLLFYPSSLSHSHPLNPTSTFPSVLTLLPEASSTPVHRVVDYWVVKVPVLYSCYPGIVDVTLMPLGLINKILAR